MKLNILLVLTMIVLTGRISAQTPVTLQDAIQTALKNNLSVQAAEQNVQAQRSLKGTSVDLPKTNVSFMYGQYNSYAKDDNNITVTQTIPFTALGSQGKLNRTNLVSRELQKQVAENELVYRVKQAYLELTYAKSRQALMLRQDSIYEGFVKSAAMRYQSGETNLLEKATAEVQRNEIRNQVRQNESAIKVLRTQLGTLLNSETMPDSNTSLIEFNSTAIDSVTPVSNPMLKFMHQQVEVAQREKKLEAARLAPDIHAGFFSQTLIGVENLSDGNLASASERFTGFQVGLSLPLWFAPHRARIRAAEFNKQAAESRHAYYKRTLKDEQLQALQQFTVTRNSLMYYRTSALPNAELMLKQAALAFKSGEINYAEHLIALRSALSIEENYLTTLRDYNQSIIYFEYLSDTK